MKKQTILTLLTAFLFIFLIIITLLYFYQKEQSITFYAEIKEKNNSNYLVTPLESETIVKEHQLINIYLDQEYQIGDIVIIKAKNMVAETYPVTMYSLSSKLYKTALKEEVESTTKAKPSPLPEEEIIEDNLTSYLISEDELIRNFSSYVLDLNNSPSNNLVKTQAKEYFINIIDFIFYEKEISGYKFKDLSNSAKLKITSIALELDKVINNLFPNYKNELSDNYKYSKNRLIIYYLETTNLFCQNNDSLCSEAKSNFQVLKTSLNLTWSFITSIKDTTVTEIQSWYEIFSGK